MSSLFDQEHQQHQRGLDAAFAAGEQRGRMHADEHLTAECVALRVRLAERQAEAYREGIETALLLVCIVAAVLAAFVWTVWFS